MTKAPRWLGWLSLVMVTLVGCNSSDWERLTDSLSDPERKTIDQSVLGVNNFFVNSEFGTINQQATDIRDSLGIKRVRVLFAWTSDVQPSSTSSAYVGFFDNIINNLPDGVEAIVVVAHTPSWMADSANWTDGNPRKTWVNRWLKPIVKRYAGNSKIAGWEIWNEPDLIAVDSDAALELSEPANYYELLSLGSQVVRTYDPGKKVIIAASEAINQKYPNNLQYNKSLRDLGAESLVDVWNIHYYSDNYDTVVVSGGIADFLNGLSVPVWVTETGSKGPLTQLEYGERTWPFLQEKIDRLERIYIYEYASTAQLSDNFGMRTTDATNPVSDLYVYLRDNH